MFLKVMGVIAVLIIEILQGSRVKSIIVAFLRGLLMREFAVIGKFKSKRSYRFFNFRIVEPTHIFIPIQ